MIKNLYFEGAVNRLPNMMLEFVRDIIHSGFIF